MLKTTLSMLSTAVPSGWIIRTIEAITIAPPTIQAFQAELCADTPKKVKGVMKNQKAAIQQNRLAVRAATSRS
jgi:hypothetical protein